YLSAPGRRSRRLRNQAARARDVALTVTRAFACELHSRARTTYLRGRAVLPPGRLDIRADPGAGPERVEGAAHEHGDRERLERLERARVQHPGPSARQRRRLGVAQAGERAGALVAARVAAHDAGHVGPDLDALGLERPGEHGGSVVGAAAA